MRDFIEILSSLVKPLFNGIFQVLTGGFGRLVAFLSWVGLLAQFDLAYGHTHTLIATVVLALPLILTQAAGALWAFMIVNGAAYETNASKKSDFATLKFVAMVVSALFVLLAGGVTVLVLGHFVGILGRASLIGHECLFAAVLAYFVVRKLESLSKR